MAAMPIIPQRVPNISIGDAQEGSEIINVRVQQGEATRLELAADAVWELEISSIKEQLVDLSASKDFLDDGWRGAAAQLIRRINKVLEGHPVKAKKHMLQIELPQDISPESARSFAIGLVVGGHTFVVSNDKPQAKVRKIHCVLPDGVWRPEKIIEAIHDGRDLGAATCISRDLANAPSNVKTPQWLAKQAKKLVSGIDGVKVKLRDEHWLEQKGFGGVLAVGKGSVHPPMLIELVWDPEAVGIEPQQHTIALVGKGVTFDTGGISIKPSAHMASMRTDMTGGASVIAAFRLLARRQIARKVVALIPTAENMPSGSAYRPGDVVEHYGGLTSEISNTDAEGRLLLADATSYVTRKYKPEMVVTVATLTGAAKIALGLRTGAVFSPDFGTGVKLARRGAVVGERWWPMPQPEYLEESVDSTVADIRQAPSGPGASTAAMFVRRFTRDVPHIHLDIAGPGRAETTYDEVTPLGTGFAARTLVQWLST